MYMKHRYFFFAAILTAFMLALPTQAAPGTGELVKLSCPLSAGSTHPCRAVYYVGQDGKRHAFPNQHVYFSWYDDWSGILAISSADMSALPLGRNVTYRPGVKLVKFPTVPQTYAVDTGGVLRWVKTETAARALYGANWAQNTDDISETFYTDYTFGPDISSGADFDPFTVRDGSRTIDSVSASTYVFQTVSTTRGNFDAHVVTLDRASFQMKTLNAGTGDCENNCSAITLADLANRVGAEVGIHGTYFCPPDYGSCAAEINSYNGPLYDSVTGYLHNPMDVFYHLAPMIAESSNGQLVYYSQAPQFSSIASFGQVYGSPLHSAIANYPGLINNSAVIVESEDRLENSMRTNLAPRGAIGWNQDNYILVIAPSATVVDLAYIMKELGATHAMNLDGGGTSALLYGGAYKVGPGRLLPNAIVFTER